VPPSFSLLPFGHPFPLSHHHHHIPCFYPNGIYIRLSCPGFLTSSLREELSNQPTHISTFHNTVVAILHISLLAGFGYLDGSWIGVDKGVKAYHYIARSKSDFTKICCSLCLRERPREERTIVHFDSTDPIDLTFF